MGKLKRFALGTVITATALAGLTGLWYRSHYTLPPIIEGNIILPSPNGFDTLQDALKLTAMEHDGVTIRPKPIPGSSPTRYMTFPLPKRLELVQANAASIAKTREALAQKYLTPPHGSAGLKGAPLRDQARVLIFAGDTYADSGNLPEAVRCYLDAIESGVAIPHGGSVIPFLYGTACEALGHKALSGLVDKLDAKTARMAAERLAQIEQERTPFPEILHQENHNLYHEMQRLFTSNPLTAWKNTRQYFGMSDEMAAFTASMIGEEKPAPPSLAEKVRVGTLQVVVTYQGPGPTIEELDRWMNEAARQSQLPWGPQRPPLREPEHNLLARIIGPVFAQTEFHDLRVRTNLALLQTRLRLRATLLETGRYPTTLEHLPIDPFSPTRNPLSYRSDGKTFTLWSVGPDARDNNGTPILAPDGDRQRRPNILANSLGDIVAGISTW
jgi:hypothetical protein